MALAVVIFALVVIEALVAGAFYAAHLEQRAGRNSLYTAQALSAAEAGIAVVLGEWETIPQLAGLAVTQSIALPTVALGARAAYQPTVLRLTDGLYLIRSEGTRAGVDGSVLARRVVAVVARSTGSAVAPLLQRSWAQVY